VPSLDHELTARRAASAGDQERGHDPAPSSTPQVDRVVTLADGRRISAAEWGAADGRAVFLLHGMPGSRLLCPDPDATMDLGIRLIAIDRPGYGRSTPLPGRTVADGAADVAAVAAVLGIDEYGIVGWSSGGPYAIAAAAVRDTATRPRGRLRAIAVVASDAPIDEVGAGVADLDPDLRRRVEAARRGDPAIVDVMAGRLAWYRDDPGQMLRLADENLTTDGADALAEDPDARLRARPRVRAALDAMFAEGARQGVEGFVEDWIATVVPWGFRFGDVDVPVDLWWGERDALTGREHAEALARLLPAARLTVVPDAGHSVAMTHWREILEGLLRSWATASEGSAD